MGRPFFPADDETWEQEDVERAINGIDRDMAMMADERHRLKKIGLKKQLDPVTSKLVELAQNAGHALGANEALGNRIQFLEKRIAVRDEELERTSDRDEWKARAEAAEATIERSKKLKRRR